MLSNLMISQNKIKNMPKQKIRRMEKDTAKCCVCPDCNDHDVNSLMVNESNYTSKKIPDMLFSIWECGKCNGKYEAAYPLRNRLKLTDISLCITKKLKRSKYDKPSIQVV
jgi:hypothetical protein